LLIDILTKLSKNLSKGISGSLGLQIYCNKNMVKVAPTHKKKGQSKDSQPQDDQSKTQTNKGNRKSKKDIGNWCEFHKIPWHNKYECHSKQSLLVELKEK
jgi:hypothetical protein